MGDSLAKQLARRIEQTGSCPLTPEELAALERHWPFWARPEQLPPDRPWNTWVLCCGRAWGKTRTAAEWARLKVLSGAMYIALVGRTSADVRDVMIEGKSGILAVFPPNECVYEPTKRRVTHKPTGCILTAYADTEPDLLRGPEHDAAWVDEVASFANLEETLSNLRMGLRGGTRKNPPQVVFSTTPRPIPLLRELYAKSQLPGSRVVWTRGTSYENAANLPEDFFRSLIAEYEGTRLGQQELEAALLDDLEGALFKKDWILRAKDVPARFDEIVVALDPAITTRNDETGLVVVGRLGRLGYVLDDKSGKHTPREWAREAVRLFKLYRHRSSNIRIVAETNRGGDLVAATIHSEELNIPVREVRANRGKDLRAEPVSALYEQGRIFHVAEFPELVHQMVTWDPTSQDAQRERRQATSPDRLDALVWGLSSLALSRPTPRFVPLDEPIFPSEV